MRPGRNCCRCSHIALSPQGRRPKKHQCSQYTAESEAILAAAVAPLERDGPLNERLGEVGTALARGVLRPEVVQLRRLAISTAVEFPDSATLYWRRGPASTIAMLTERFTALDAAGEIVCPEPLSTATLFAYALIGPLQDRVMFDAGFEPGADEIDRHVARAVSMLVRSVSGPADGFPRRA
jgi:TetR/AcrR family transcriptional repressor of mexJK operon